MRRPSYSSLVTQLDVITHDHEPERFYLGYWHGVSISIWACAADEEFMRRAAALGELMSQDYPEGRTNVTFVLKGTPPPRQEVRGALQRYYAGASGVRCFGMVLEDEGFWASALRAMITNMGMQGAENVALRTAGSLDEIAPWVAQMHKAHVGEEIPAGALASVLRRTRHELAPPLLFPEQADPAR